MWDTVEKILIAALAILLIFWFRPNIKRSFESSRKATKDDWKGLLVPLLLVILFVVFLISQA